MHGNTTPTGRPLQRRARTMAATLTLPAHGIVESAVPAACMTLDCKLGIDEAGRGAVLGPMTYGCAFWTIADDDELCAMGFDDSKALKEEQRAKLFDRLHAEPRIGWAVKLISSKAISSDMLAREVPTSLNKISHDAAAELIRRALDRGVKLTEVYVDTVGDPISYRKKLEREFPGIKVTVEEKADSKFKTVSAASIGAKVTLPPAVSPCPPRRPSRGARAAPRVPAPPLPRVRSPRKKRLRRPAAPLTRR